MLGALADEEHVEGLLRLGEALRIPVSVVEDYWEAVVRASVRLLVELEWRENVTVFAERAEILDGFGKLSRTFSICVGNFIVLE